jgi:hypothetical protein
VVLGLDDTVGSAALARDVPGQHLSVCPGGQTNMIQYGSIRDNLQIDDLSLVVLHVGGLTW